MFSPLPEGVGTSRRDERQGKNKDSKSKRRIENYIPPPLSPGAVKAEAYH